MRRALCELREAVLEQVGKDQTDRLCHALDVAVATVTSTMSPYTGPDGVKQGPQKQVRTFIAVKRGERWLIMQDHTTVAAPPA